MQDKKEKNRFKKVLFDYYLTNKEIARNERKREGYSHKGFTARERAMLIILIILFIVLIIKSVALDPYNPQNKKEEQFKQFVNYSIDKTYENGGLGMHGIFAYRMIDLEKSNQEGIIKYENEKTGMMEEISQNPTYVAKVRKYFLGIIPVSTIVVSTSQSEDVHKHDEEID